MKRGGKMVEARNVLLMSKFQKIITGFDSPI
jgi:hypothetical protein